MRVYILTIRLFSESDREILERHLTIPGVQWKFEAVTVNDEIHLVYTIVTPKSHDGSQVISE